MKKSLISLVVLAAAGAAFAQVDPARPMLTGHGNVDGRPGTLIVTNQTAAPAEQAIKLEKFEVTGSLMRVNPAKPMLTGRGNVSGRPGTLIVTNQTATGDQATIKLEKFEVTGSLIRPVSK
jgi:hypothetical protein